MKITFITLPYSPKPAGGQMVIYEYATRLVARGHEITVVHPRRRKNIRPSFSYRLYLWLAEVVRYHNKIRVREIPWYSIDSRVTVLDVPELATQYIPDGDAIFNNRYVEALPQEKGKEFLLVQSYGTNAKLKGREDATLREPIGKVFIARWLYEKGLELGVPADEMIHIPNGIDHGKYRLLQPINNRAPRLAMLYHNMPLKGSQDGVEALKLVREQFPTLQAVLFGVFPRPEDLPDWIEYHCDPSQEVLVESIYNGSSIYLCPSWREGWHLPPAEAMACGCAVASTNIGGVRDYAEHEVTALLSLLKNPEALAANILRLLEDDDLRIRLAKAGHERIQEFTWERSADLLEQFIKDRIGQASR